MKPKELLTADYLDIVYDQRNKSYGGYELRKHYDQRLRKAAVLALTGVAAMLSFSFISAHRGRDADGKPNVIPIVMTEIIHQPVTPPPAQVLPPQPPPSAVKPLRSTAFTPPVIEPDNVVKPDDIMARNEDLKNSNPGLTNNADGDSTGIGSELVKTTGGGGTVVVSTDRPSTPVSYVGQMPQFNGDMQAYISRNIHYPEVARENGIEGKVIVRFVVNEDGAVSNAEIMRSVAGGCDQEALRIVYGMPKWKPGKNNGIPVKVYFVLPIVFQLN